MLQQKAMCPQQRAGASRVIQPRTLRVRSASSPQQQTVGLQTTTSNSAEYEALKGIKVVSAADGFEVDLLSLWQVSMGWCMFAKP